MRLVLPFKKISKKDLLLVGGKNSSLGEMHNALSSKGINVPDGFATTSQAYFKFLEENNLTSKLKKIFKNLDINNISELQKAGQEARKLVSQASFSEEFIREIKKHYRDLGHNVSVAVRSSATAEDLPGASFAGLHETYLNVKGEDEVVSAVKKCIVSLFGDRVISYRENRGFDHFEVALSVGVQRMIRSDVGSSGVMFTMDTETGFSDVVLINSIFGVGEMIVQGKITPDEFYIFKPTLAKNYKSIITKNLGQKKKKYVLDKKQGLKEVDLSQKESLTFSLSDEDALTLARWAVTIEKHYQIPQDIEWAKDGLTGELFIVQSRPETVHSEKKKHFYEEYRIKPGGKILLEGIAVGDKIGSGKVRVIPDASRIKEFKKGEVLVTKMTDPDWVSIMRMASAIVTDEGGKVCHAAIIGRELGVPVIVGSKKATQVLKTNQEVTVDCTQGSRGRIFKGILPYTIKKYDLGEMPNIKTKIMLNVGTPETAFKSSFLPNNGVGLAREEFIIAEKIRVHPLALYHYREIQNPKSEIRNKLKISNSEIQKIIKEIDEITVEHKDKKEHFIKELAEGVSLIASAFYPKEVIVRFSDFKSNEYNNLVGGNLFEKQEANPMIGFRGACRYLSKEFQPAFKMECQAIKRAREVFGLKNISVMVPFCRTVEEGRQVVNLIKKFGLEKVKVYVMCEIPSNVVLAEDFLKVFDGMSIGSNDLTQLVLGLDRDNADLAHIGDETNKAVMEMISKVIKVCRKKKKYCGICGDAPSSLPEFNKFLLENKMPSISLTPDAAVKAIMNMKKNV